MASSAGDARRRHELLGVADRLHSVAIQMLRRVRREDVASGVSAAQLSTLSVVVHAGPLPLGRLAAAEQVRPPTMSRLVDALERRGLVGRVVDPGDRRVVLIAATEAGMQVLGEGRSRRVQALGELLASLSEEELGVLGRAAALLEGALRDSRQHPEGDAK